MITSLDLQWGNATCPIGHPLWLVNEGYAYCDNPVGGFRYTAWRLTEPRTPRTGAWGRGDEMWIGPTFPTKDGMLAFIQADMDVHNAFYERSLSL